MAELGGVTTVSFVMAAINAAVGSLRTVRKTRVRIEIPKRRFQGNELVKNYPEGPQVALPTIVSKPKAAPKT